MRIIGFGEFISAEDGHLSQFARIVTADEREFDLPLLPAQLNLLRDHMREMQETPAPEPGPTTAPRPPSPQAVQPPRLVSNKLQAVSTAPSNDPWGDDEDEPGGFALAVSIDQE